MKRFHNRSLAATLLILSAPTAFAQSAVLPEGLRTEYLADPLGIDVEQPRLSWTLSSARGGEKQTAYQVLVASSPANLAKDAGDLWDSRKVTSAETAQVTYAGRTLTSRMRTWWKVRAWDAQGRPGPWSKPATWSMGLLRESDWDAAFIGAAPPAGTPA
ncbi:MAG: hypothetical protein NTW28_35250, partial [Candidatus Solibacter sp.]|nr:hypothetical protein [Candidatus Solibacter sp.]